MPLVITMLSGCSYLPEMEWPRMEWPHMEWPPTAKEEPAAVKASEPVNVSDYLGRPGVDVYLEEETALGRRDLNKTPYSLSQPSDLPAPIGPGRQAPNEPGVMVYPLIAGNQPPGVPTMGRTVSRPVHPPFTRDPSSARPNNRPHLPATSPLSAGRPVPAFSPLADRAAAGTMVPSRIYFKHDSEQLDRADREALKRLAAKVITQNLPVTITGHASPRAAATQKKTRDIVNLKVSLDRAYEVSQFLIREGVPASSITTVGLGDTQPGMVEPGMGSEEASRRVEIRLGR